MGQWANGPMGQWANGPMVRAVRGKKMNKLKMHSSNLTQDNIARIRELFPGCVTEAQGEDGSLKLAVDFDQLRQELADSVVEGPQERYHLNWPGKREALLTPMRPLPRPCVPVARRAWTLIPRRTCYRGRQSRRAEATAGNLPRQDQDDLYRSAVQHRQ